jgi:hypothetical protein
MTVRPFRDEDRKFLDNVSRETGYPYPNVDDHLTECIMIAEENGKPVAALLARRAAHLYVYVDKGVNPLRRLHALRKVSEFMKPIMRLKGYTECDGYLVPSIERSFGRRVMRSFGAVKNWTSYCFRFGDE